LFLIALNLSSEIRLGYCNLFNIAVYAMTPPTILALVHILTGANFWHFNIVYIITYIAYLVLGYTYARKNLIVEYDEES
jgi:phosphotransferase system  glucose/maltose/N-acetylglucosamine-specific IIC component